MSIELPGWDCRSCGAFNGEAKERLRACRCCGLEKRSRVDRAAAVICWAGVVGALLFGALSRC